MIYTSSERPPEAVDLTNFPSECRSKYVYTCVYCIYLNI